LAVAKARPINHKAFPQMIGNTRTQNTAGAFGNGMQMGFPGMQDNNGFPWKVIVYNRM
jgi:hypothetical protein